MAKSLPVTCEPAGLADGAPIAKMRVQRYTYPGAEQQALVDICIDIGRGEYVLIAGPSGGGKSTLCRCLTGLIPHFYAGDLVGTVEVFGQDVATLLPHELVPRVGMVFQNPQDQLLAVAVEDDVAFGPQQLGLARPDIGRRVEAALATVGAADMRRRSVFDLSSGQQQRVALAGALALQPELLILDEPTSQLDPTSAAAFLDTVARLHREQGTTIVVVEHRLAVALPAADRLVIVADGRIAWDGPPRRALANSNLDTWGLAIPPVVRLALDITKAGIVLDPLPLTVDEAAAAISRVMDSHVARR